MGCCCVPRPRLFLASSYYLAVDPSRTTSSPLFRQRAQSNTSAAHDDPILEDSSRLVRNICYGHPAVGGCRRHPGDCPNELQISSDIQHHLRCGELGHCPRCRQRRQARWCGCRRLLLQHLPFFPPDLCDKRQGWVWPYHVRVLAQQYPEAVRPSTGREPPLGSESRLHPGQVSAAGHGASCHAGSSAY